MAPDMTPPAAAPEFLARSGWGGATIVPLAGDASFRRYFRATDGKRDAVLMDAPPPHEDPRAFLAVARHLRRLGFAAPTIFGEDLRHGLVLLEDFGDARMREIVDADPARERDTYRAAVDLLASLHRTPPAKLAPYSRDELHREVAIFTDWYCPAVELKVDGRGWHDAWDVAFDRIGTPPPVTVLRDYHAENIMLRDDEQGFARLGLLDFQDALIGNPAYDLVSLLQDARRTVSCTVEQEMIAYYQQAARPLDGFDNDYAILGGQRNSKILGIFARLWKRDAKPRYLSLIPRVWHYLERDLAHPALHEVAAWLDAHVPPGTRASHWPR